MKYALYTYTTENIGDDIQSIAARRFLPTVDYRIDRDLVGLWNNPEPTEKVKLITNGWYMHKPYAWPVKDKSLNPLYISLYVEQEDNRVVKAFLTDESRRKLNAHGKVGARDAATKKFFESHGIEAYLSGCVTLTLQKDENIKKHDFILLTDVSEKIYNYIKKNTDKKVVYLSNVVSTKQNIEVRDELAELYLYLYQSATCVITERLHTALPSLALETPVVLIRKDNPIGGNDYRLRGLGELAHYLTEDEFLEGKVFDINNPKANKPDYKKYRQSLIRTCSDFTGYNNQQSFSRSEIGYKSFDEVLDRVYFLSQMNLKQLSIETSLNRYKLNQMFDLEHVVEDQKIELNKLMGVKFTARRLAGNIKRRILNGK